MAADVLLTGATGYIGGRLLPLLHARGQRVRVLVRQPSRLPPGASSAEVVQGDLLDSASMRGVLDGVKTAFYLVHSMAAGAQFRELDHRAAVTFGQEAARAGVERIVYLGGLGEDDETLSPHLRSRAETGEALRQSGVPVVELRASVVIGAGSLSFEMIAALVERLPAMICPRWVGTRTQPIAIDDVLAYLMAAMETPMARLAAADRRLVFEIGSPEVVSYGDMLRAYARLRGLRRLLIPVPVLTPRLSGLWLGLVTPAQARVGRALVEGLRNATVVRSPAAAEAFAIAPMPLHEALARALREGLPSRLKTDTRFAIADVPPAQAFAPIRRIGGDAGWYFGRGLWQARGLLDRLLGGPGMRAGRHDAETCAAGDTIDGWRVDRFEADHRLTLAAGMKLPGRGWLEFEVTPIDDGARALIRQTASFDPRGLLGRAYWYAVLPLHAVVFTGMLRGIVGRAEAGLPRRPGASFRHGSVISSPASDVFAWHERPEALDAMLPRGMARVESRSGGVHDGARVTLSFGVGPVRARWEARHHGYIKGRQFCDEQIRGPFHRWHHTHSMYAIDRQRTWYEDRVDYALTGSPRLNGLIDVALRPLLTLAFAQRHRTVRAAVSRAPLAPVVPGAIVSAPAGAGHPGA